MLKTDVLFNIIVETEKHYHSKVWSKKKEDINNCIKQSCIKLMKSDSKNLYKIVLLL